MLGSQLVMQEEQLQTQQPEFASSGLRPPRALDVPRALPVTLVLASGLLLTFVLWILVRLRIAQDEAQRLESLASDRVAALQAEIDDRLGELATIGDFFLSSESVTREEFERFASGTLGRSPGTLALEWVPSVTHAEIEALEAQRRSQGLEHFAVHELGPSGELVPVGLREEYFPTDFAITRNAALDLERLAGFDHGCDPEWLAAMRQARSSGSAVASVPRLLTAVERGKAGGLDGTDLPLCVHVYQPIYGGKAAPGTTQGRDAHLKGFACAVIDLRAFLAHSLSWLPEDDLKLWVYSSEQARPGSALYRNSRDEDLAQAGHVVQHALRFGTQPWSVRSRPGTTLFDSDALPWDWAALLAGLLVTAAAGALAHRSLDARKRLRKELDSFWKLSADMLCVADIGGRLLRVNPAWQRLLGYTEDELYARPFLAFVHPEDRSATRAEAGRLARGGEPVVFTNRFRAHDGSYRWLSWQAVPAGRPGNMYAVARDVTEERGAFREMERMATTDGLTGLLNRRALLARLRQELARARRYQQPLCLALLDIDHFKQVNDLYGHATGDELLRHTVGVLLDNLRETDVAGRLGGDEFVVLFLQTEHAQAARVVARWRDKLKEAPAVLAPDGSEVRSTLSIGLAALTEEVSGPDELLRRADEALYRSKQAGRDRSTSY